MKNIQNFTLLFFIAIGLQQFLHASNIHEMQYAHSVSSATFLNLNTEFFHLPIENQRQPTAMEQATIQYYVDNYKSLNEGFIVLQSRIEWHPTFKDFLIRKVCSNKTYISGDISSHELIPDDVFNEAEAIILNEIKPTFLELIDREIGNAMEQRKRALHTTQLPNFMPIQTLISIPNIESNLNPYKEQANDHSHESSHPIFQYVIAYQHGFMQSPLQAWFKSQGAKSITQLRDAISSNHIPIVKLLLDAQVRPHNINMSLYFAVYDQKSVISELLLNAGAHINVKITSSLLDMAITNDDIETTRILLDYHANKEELNSDGNTPLCLAISLNHPAIVELLLNNGANPNNPKALKDFKIMKYFNAHDHIFDNYYTNALANSLPNFNDTSERDTYGKTPLQIAANKNFIAIAHMLINAGANLNSSNIFFGTALQIARRKNHTEIENMLIAAGAQEYIPQPTGNNANLVVNPMHAAPLLGSMFQFDEFPFIN